MLERVLEHAGSVAIGGHVRPDGDCVGSCMGLYQYLVDNYKDLKVKVYLEEIPEPLKCIEATEKICHEFSEEEQS